MCRLYEMQLEPIFPPEAEGMGISPGRASLRPGPPECSPGQRGRGRLQDRRRSRGESGHAGPQQTGPAGRGELLCPGHLGERYIKRLCFIIQAKLKRVKRGIGRNRDSDRTPRNGPLLQGPWVDCGAGSELRPAARQLGRCPCQIPAGAGGPLFRGAGCGSAAPPCGEWGLHPGDFPCRV